MNRRLRGAILVAALLAMLGSVVGVAPSAAVSGVRPPAAAAATAPRPAAEAQFEILARPKIFVWSQDINVEESGDPDAPVEVLVVDERALENVLRETHALAAFPTRKRRYKNARRVAERMLQYALEYADQRPPVSRRSSPAQVREFVGLFDYKSENVPFCAMGVAFAMSKAYCDSSPERITYNARNDTSTFQKVLPLMKKFYFTPSPSCRFMMNEAKKRKFGQRGSWVAKGELRPRRAWLVLFDWKKGKVGRDGIPDHVGIVHAVDARDQNKVHTVEFNTSIKMGSQSNGGAVARKVRDVGDILGFIRTY